MADLINSLFNKARRRQKKILFPETDDQRVLQALVEIIDRKLCHPVLIGDKKTIARRLRTHGLKTAHQDRATDTDAKAQWTVISPNDAPLRAHLVKKLCRIRKNKGMTQAAALELLKQRNYFATTCLAAGLADGMVSGAATTTADVLRPALQIIRTPRGKRASGAFLLLPRTNNRAPTRPGPHALPDRGGLRGPLLFADCAVTPDPDAHQLAEIADDTTKTARMLGITPHLAFLSFSSHGSAEKLPQVEKVQQAYRQLKKRVPRLTCDGEIQADAALDATVARLKVPGSPLHGQANILIFPNLDAGNIGYKLVERLAGATAVGTIVQGLKKPVNDLSRGCAAEDIVNLTVITVLQTIAK